MSTINRLEKLKEFTAGKLRLAIAPIGSRGDTIETPHGHSRQYSLSKLTLKTIWGRNKRLRS